MGANGKPNRKGSAGLLWRGQTAPEEWATARACEDLIQRGQVAAIVDARTGGRCYMPGCPYGIISYPHAIPYSQGGSNAAINRFGVCGVHATAVHSLHDGLELREFFRAWLTRWYRENDGMSPEVWEASAGGRRVDGLGVLHGETAAR